MKLFIYIFSLFTISLGSFAMDRNKCEKAMKVLVERYQEEVSIYEANILKAGEADVRIGSIGRPRLFTHEMSLGFPDVGISSLGVENGFRYYESGASVNRVLEFTSREELEKFDRIPYIATEKFLESKNIKFKKSDLIFDERIYEDYYQYTLPFRASYIKVHPVLTKDRARTYALSSNNRKLLEEYREFMIDFYSNLQVLGHIE